jgi:hypothetical protein
MFGRRHFRPLVVIMGLIGSCVGQQSPAQVTAAGVTITEPGVYQLASLFQHSDIVAVVKVISGDAESYDSAVYKGEIIKSYKGKADGEIIYFGPYVGERLGWEYVLFLRNRPEPITPKPNSVSYGKIHYSEVFDEGYSSMETSYECIFDGRETRDQCDYGVRVCTDYIKLPKGARTFPPEGQDAPFGCRWVRKTSFLSLLEGLHNPK